MENRGHWRRARVAFFIAMAFGVATSRADAQDPGRQSPRQDSSCKGKQLDLSHEKLVQIAVVEYKKQGGLPKSGKVEAEVKRDGCDWLVRVLFSPPKPDNYFGVVVDGLTGEVKRYIPGG
jgi:hypothetical protein